jgi:23S rRNA pseudouridine1911/1915/1917 synthase
MTVSDRLREQFPTAKRQTLKRMVENRRVLINGRSAKKLSQPIEPEDRITVATLKKPIEPKLPFPIIFEDRDILVINKPAGLLTSTVPGERRPTALAIVTRYLKVADPRVRVGLVHRLDREAGGLLVFTKTAVAYASLKGQFFHHTVTRIYHAVVSPPPAQSEGRIESRLVERADGSVHSTLKIGKGRLAITDFAVISHVSDSAHLRVTLRTGRKHQIRAHLSELGSPIVGDIQYGAASPNGLQLMAVELAFDHPRTGQRVTFKCSPPHRATEQN